MEEDLTLEEAQARETYWIGKLRTHATEHRQGYNATWGGEDPDWDPDDYKDWDDYKEYRSPGENCPSCGGTLSLRDGLYGEFLGCSEYPECQYSCSVE